MNTPGAPYPREASRSHWPRAGHAPWKVFRSSALLACGTAAFAFATARAVGDSLWWLGAAVFILLAHAWQVFVRRGFEVERTLGPERLALNLKAEGLADRPAVFPYRVRAVVLGFAAVGFVIYGMQDDIVRAARWAQQAVRKETPHLRVEAPSYTETAAAETPFSASASDVPSREAEVASYLEFYLKDRKPGTRWNLVVKNPQGAEGRTEAVRPLGGAGQLGLSAGSLLEILGLSREIQAPQTLSLEMREDDGRRVHFLSLTLLPVPRPVVEIEPLGQVSGRMQGGDFGEGQGGGSDGSTGEVEEDTRLRLRVKADSRVPLALVELHVRTQSGYRFTKTIGEFANAKELRFESDKSELSLLGVPFKSPDTLYVKAVARTVVPDLFGESREIAYRVRTKQQAREEIIKDLQDAKKALAGDGNAEEIRAAVKEKLEGVASKVPELGRRHPVARQTREALSALEKMTKKGDEPYAEVEKRIDAALESLKREKNADATSSLIARMQSLRDSIAASDKRGASAADENKGESKNADDLSEEAKALAEETRGLKKELGEQADAASSGFSLEEKQQAKDLLARDKTDEKLGAAGEALEKNDKAQAQAGSQAALDEAQKGLGQVMQMMQAARQRAMREAREKLTQADGKLQEARDRLQANESGRGENEKQQSPSGSLDEAGDRLQETPRLTREFNEAVNEARQEQRDARKKSDGKEKGAAERHIEGAQDAVVRALAALQEEESADEEQKREQEGRQSRSQNDAINAQGQLDVGWRKRILEEIARLKASGEGADAPVIRYLESRLR